MATLNSDLDLSLEAVREAAAHLEGRADNSHKLWALIQFELWLSTFVDGGRSELQSLASPQSAGNPAAATA